MTGLQTMAPAMLAAVEGGNEVKNFPLFYQIAFVVFIAIFVWIFAIARDPRGWRRLYQAKFTKPENFSVNKNKMIDENIKKYGIPVSMVFLVAAVGMFLLGVTHRYRHREMPTTQEGRFREADSNRLMQDSQKAATRRGSGKE